MASCPDSDNSWVLAGSESLPVETLGPGAKMDPEPQGAPPAPGSPSKADGEDAEELAGTLDGEETLPRSEDPQAGPSPPEETEAQGALEGDGHGTELPGAGDTVALGDVEEVPLVADLGPGTQDLGDQSLQQSLPSPSSPAWPQEAARKTPTSSEEDTDADMEGLRHRRRGGEPRASLPGGPPRAEDPARGEGVSGEPGISLNTCLLGALVLLGLGILLFSGGLSESENGSLEEVELQVFPDATVDAEMVGAAAGDGPDGRRQPLQASAPPDSAPSLQSMALLLDKLAKENQDIRLLQAQLQAQKEELQSLMHRPQVLEAENAQLRGALQQGEASQRALESELQQLRARLQGLEAACLRGPDGVCLSWGGGPQGAEAPREPGPQGQEPGAGFLEQKERLEAEARALRRELERQQQLLGSVQRDLEQSLREAGPGGPSHAGLAELGHRLAQRLQGLGNWGQPPRVPGNTSEAGRQEPHVRGPRERGGKEKRWRGGQEDRQAEPWKHGKDESGWEGKKSGGRKEDREPAGRWKEEGKEGKEGKRQGPKEPPRKHGSPHSSGERQHPQAKEGPKDQHDPAPSWAQLSRRKYRAPQGCSGVRDCARQEGLTMFGAELAPVRRQELASLLSAYLARLPWAGPLAEELPLWPAYFGEDGVFRHDRLRFRDFVDALEDSLEAAAVRERGSDDEVDDFEDFVFSHFFGDRARKKRLGADVCAVLRLSGPLKEQYAQEHGLNFQRLLDASAYKEAYRRDMILWGEAQRQADPGFFCRKVVEGVSQPVWLVSDTRRMSDIQWFREAYGAVTQTVRVVASEQSRRQRGWVFTPGVDDGDSECGLDSFGAFDWVLENDGDERRLGEQLESLEGFVRSRL